MYENKEANMVSWQTLALEIYLRFNRLLSGNSTAFDIAKDRADAEAMASMFKPIGEIRCTSVNVDGIPAEWIIPEKEKSGRVILFLHGGSFNSGSIKSHRTLAGNLAISTRSRALLIDYRLAPEYPFPAGIEDAIKAYRWLLAQGVDPNRMVVAGDSAGGTLVLNLLIHLRDKQATLPAAGVCLSPAPDLSFSGESWKFNAKKDLLLIESKEQKSIDIYLNDVDRRSPLASPTYANLPGLPPLLIQVGSHELLLSDCEHFAEKAKSAGVDVTLEVWPRMQHEWQFAANFLPEGRRALSRIGEYVETIFS
jgi:acetyl esterase/lipase